MVQWIRIERGSMIINHLFFADNSILFGETTKEGVDNIYRIIANYDKASG